MKRWSRIGHLSDSLLMTGVRCSGNPQCAYIGHFFILGGVWLSSAIFIFFLASPPKGGMWSSRWTSAIHF